MTETVTQLTSTIREWTNEEIVDGLLGKNPAAGQALFEKFYSSVFARVHRLLGSDSECEDLVQQVFFTLIDAIKKIREPSLLSRWIDRITVNTVRKELRRRRRRWYITYVAEPPETAEDAMQKNDLLFSRTASVLESMHPEERIAFVLRFVAEEEIAQIAAMCGWSVSTTKRRIAKARENFLKKAVRNPMLQTFMEGLSDGQTN